MQVPTLDFANLIGNARMQKNFAHELEDGFSEVGFIVLKNHPISHKLQADFHKACLDVFSMSLEEKKSYQMPGFKGQRGFVSFGSETAVGAQVSDLKEFWQIGRDLEPCNQITKDYFPNVFPAQVPEFEFYAIDLFEKLEVIGQELMTSIASILNLAPEYFHGYVANGNSIIRALHYPAYSRHNLGDEELRQKALRAAAHTDINLITLLLGASQEGLQVQTQSGEWVAITCEPDELVVNVGDMLQRLTNGVLSSTLHRVVDPVNYTSDSAGSDWNPLRISAPFFLHPSSNMPLNVLESCVSDFNPIQYPDTNAGAYLHQRLCEIGLAAL